MKKLSLVTGILLALCAAVLALQLFMEAGTLIPFKIAMTAANILIAALGAVYLLTGAKKVPGGALLKLYLVLNLITELGLFIAVGLKQAPIAGISYALTFAGFAVLTLIPDLGALRSKLVALFICAVELVHVTGRLINAPDFSISGLGQLTRLVIVLSLLVMIWAKYKDKAARGAK